MTIRNLLFLLFCAVYIIGCESTSKPSDNGNGSPESEYEQIILPSTEILTSVSVSGNGDVYAGSSKGLYYYNRSSRSFSLELQGKYIDDVAIANGAVIVCVANEGVYRKQLGTTSWTNINSFPSAFSSYVLSVSNGSTIWLSASPDGSSQQRKLFRSDDAGNTWTEVLSFNGGTNAVGVLILGSTSTGKVFALTKSDLYYSLDNGTTWKSSGLGSGYSLLTVTPNGRAIIAKKGEKNGRYTDDTTNFKDFSSPDKIQVLSSSADAKVIIQVYQNSAEGYDIYSSTDIATGWNRLGSSPFTYAGCFSANEISINGSYIAAATDGFGIYYSSNNGSLFSSIGPPSEQSVNGIATNSTGELIIASGALYRTSDNGITWRDMPGGWRTQYNGLASERNKKYLVASSGGNAYASVNDGEGWGRSAVSGSNTVRGVAIANDGTMFAAGSSDLHRSTNQGYSWQKFNMSPSVELWTVVAVTNDEIYICGKQNTSFVFLRSNNGGLNFTTASDTFPKANIKTFVVSPRGYFYSSYTGSKTIMFSKDKGITWESYSLPEISSAEVIQSLGFDAAGRILIGTNRACYRSKIIL